ncbi:inaD-like protein isoform X2 [Montipora foliosa]|uniref:inaD-like protein isoform X2 n=1 Tax=Montipora foliosa TaxID=591990 RepID=UPI0035F145DC
MTTTKETKESTEMTLTIKKQASGLGLEIVGGSDTYLGEVVVKSIEPESAAAKDGRIAVGDRLVMVNGGSLQGMKHGKAVSTLRLASSPIKISIIREDPEAIFTSVEEPSRVFEVRLKKSITDYIGLSILARKDKKGVFVTYVSENGIAYKEGSIYQGDKILEVNGLNLKRSTQQEAFKSLRRAFGTVTLKIGRISSLHASLCTQSNSSGSHVNHALADDEESVITEKDTINTKTLENFGYLNPESIELSLQQHNQKKGTINREDYV